MGEFVADRLAILIKEHANGKSSAFAKMAGIPYSTFHGYMKGRMPHSEHLIRIHDIFGVNINWLLTGKGSPSLQEQAHEAGLLSKVVDLQWSKLVNGFKNEKLAQQINKCLLEIERLNVDGLKSIADKAEGMLGGLKLAAIKDREIAELKKQLEESEARSRSRDPDAAANES